MALCVAAIVGPIAGLVMAPFAFLGAACALMSLVLACVEVQESGANPSTRTTERRRDAA
jgi:hypothetical protein